MSNPESGASPAGPPARGPGPVPVGYVPREWLQQGSPPPASPPDGALVSAQPFPPYGSSRSATLQPTGGVAPPAARSGPEGEVPFLDTPQIPPQTKHQAWVWLVFAGAGFVVGQLGATVFALISGAIAGKTAAQMQSITTSTVPPEWYVVSTLIGLWIGFIGAPWLASRTQGTRNFVRDLGLRFRPIDLVGIGIGIGGQFLIAVMYAPFQHDIHNFNAPSQRLTGASHGGGFVVIAIATVLFAPAVEELFFRGLLLKSLVRLFTPLQVAGAARAAGVVLAVIADGLLFGAAHGEWVQLAGLAAFGIVLAAVSYRTGRLGMNMVAHASFNLVAIIAIATGSGVIH
ncbi:MAG TPA: CPBP family glutamic-type intramembrane protease [Acidimicrobiales bacterium]|nr:CPBP family glutamic-type intramembrane protease [Acidimicrobiales bacterium]